MMKTQKTFRMGLDDGLWILKGDRMILVEETDILTGKTEYKLQEDEGGIPGNMNPSELRYHGWRGTTNNISRTAYGLREVKSIEIDYNAYGWKIVVGRDLRPELP